jgi:hypothetical protein
VTVGGTLGDVVPEGEGGVEDDPLEHAVRTTASRDAERSCLMKIWTRDTEQA